MIAVKSSAFDVFKIHKIEVENQFEKELEVLQSDRRGNYYGDR